MKSSRSTVARHNRPGNIIIGNYTFHDEKSKLQLRLRETDLHDV